MTAATAVTGTAGAVSGGLVAVDHFATQVAAALRGGAR
jgi:hypothetical protein